MKLKILLQYCLPHHGISRLIGGLAKCRWIWLKKLLINVFIKKYKIDLNDAVEQNPDDYASFNDFFTRALKPETRPIAQNKNGIICPVDGRISQIGTIENNQIFQAKGHKFSLAALLGDNNKTFNNGNFATLYLSPQDYHRIHMPLDGTLEKMTYIPGKLFSVNPLVIKNIPNLYARNERVINIFNTAIGPMAVILVGAMLVASIETVWAGEITPTGRKKIKSLNYSNITLLKGDELGRFQFGSTVILLFSKNKMTWNEKLKFNSQLIMGQQLGEIL